MTIKYRTRLIDLLAYVKEYIQPRLDFSFFCNLSGALIYPRNSLDYNCNGAIVTNCGKLEDNEGAK